MRGDIIVLGSGRLGFAKGAIQVGEIGRAATFDTETDHRSTTSTFALMMSSPQISSIEQTGYSERSKTW